MSREQLQAAKQLIEERRYAEARSLLRQIDHPTAKRWLAKLDEIAPEAKQGRSLALGFMVIIGIILLIGIGLAAIVQIAFRPTENVQVASIPTLAELPTNTPSQTPSKTPTNTLTPSLTPTLTPTATPTSTSTPKPSSTSTNTPVPSNTPFPTPVPLVGCWIDDWSDWSGIETAIMDRAQEYDNQMILNVSPETAEAAIQAYRDAHIAASLVPYPECVDTARQFLLKVLETKAAMYEAALNGDTDAAAQHEDMIALYVERFLFEMDDVVQTKIQLRLP